MVELVVRKRTLDRKKWERFVVTVEGDTDDGKLRNTLEIGNYPRRTESGEEVIYTPLQKELYLLGYLIIVHQKEALPKVQQVLEAIQNAPKHIQQKVWGFEFHHGFYDFAATDFFDLEEKGKWVSMVALLSEVNTGKMLPGVKLKFDRPIGISDERWAEFYRRYSSPYYGYIDP